MWRKVAVIGVISILTIALLTYTKVLNVQNMAAAGHDASSYSDLSAVIYIVVGVLLCFSALLTIRLHFVASVLPLGLGITLTAYGAYICWAKGMLGTIVVPVFWRLISCVN